MRIKPQQTVTSPHFHSSEDEDDDPVAVVPVGDGHDHVVEFMPVGCGPPVPVPPHSWQPVVEVVQVDVLLWL